MQTGFQQTEQHGRGRIPFRIAVCLFVAVALFFLLEEHRAHILGALPYALLALCPIIHLFMHRRHGGHGTGAPPSFVPRVRRAGLGSPGEHVHV